MKFLCVACDTPMKMQKSPSSDRGSLSVLYECPECFHQIAMLTNPMETQLVTSLGVKIGPREPTAGEQASGCPFAGMVEGMASRPAAESGGVSWTPQAEQRLANIPEFVRPMARQGIEQFARDRGRQVIDEALLDEARQFFGM